jgi:hypothetical protein
MLPNCSTVQQANVRFSATFSTDRSVISCDSKWHRLIQTSGKIRYALPLGIPTYTSKTWQSPPNSGKENEGALMIDLGKIRAVHTNHQPPTIKCRISEIPPCYSQPIDLHLRIRSYGIDPPKRAYHQTKY